MVLAHWENGRRFRLAWHAECNAFADRLALYERYFQGEGLGVIRNHQRLDYLRRLC